MEKIFVKPAKVGAVVRHPEKPQHKLAQQGEWVVLSNQWRRYLRNGDVVEVTPPNQENPSDKPEEKIEEKQSKKKAKADSDKPKDTDNQMNGGV
jgi:hypothetical protein